MQTCQTCAMEYDPKVTTSPRRYCSQECYNFGEKPYNKGSLKRKEADSCQSCGRSCPCKRAF